MNDERSERVHGSEQLEEPAGKLVPGWSGITPRTTRRQEQLDRLENAGDAATLQPPGDGEPDNRNREAERQQLELDRQTRDTTGA